MDLNLNGRVALVTGSSSGLGFEIARCLAQEQAQVVLCGRDLEKLRIAITNISKVALYKPIGGVIDAGEKDPLDSLFFYHMLPNIKTLDILVNNIGGAPKFGKFEDLTDEDWMHTFDLNVMSAVRFTRAALPLLRKSKYGGRIINIGSLPGIQPGRMNPDYAVAKTGVRTLTKCLANEFGPEGIRTNCICPNTLHGGGFERNAENLAARESIDVDEARRRILTSAAKKNPLGKVGSLADVANLVAFLVSDAAQFINGTCIPVDGGECRSI